MSYRTRQLRALGLGRILQASLAATLIFPSIARAQGTPTLPTVQTLGTRRAISLDEAVRIAEAQSEAVRIARAGVQRAEGQQYQARSQRLPQLSGSAAYTRTLASQFSVAEAPAPDTSKPVPPPAPCDQYLRDASATNDERLTGLEESSRCALGGNPFSSFGSLGFGAKNQYNLGLAFSQNLFAGGRINAQNAVADAGRRSADIELTAQRAQIRLNVTQAYFDAALADRLVALAESSAVQTDNVLKQTRLARNVGNVSEFELLRAQVSSANQRPIVIQRQSAREVAYLTLKQVLNLPLDSALQLTTAVDDSVATNAALRNLGITSDTAAIDRATVRQAALAIDAQRGLLRVAKGQRLPTLSLTSAYGKVAFPLGSFPQSGDFRTNWTIGLASQVPLFTGGRIKGDQMVAEANVRDAQARYDQVRKLAALDARVTINDLAQARAEWQASLGTAEQAARAYSIAEVRYKEGISTQIELNDSRILLEQAVTNRALAARNLQVARVKLALLPDLPLQNTAGAAGQGQIQSTVQQQQTQQTTQSAVNAQTQQVPGQTGAPPQ